MDDGCWMLDSGAGLQYTRMQLDFLQNLRPQYVFISFDERGRPWRRPPAIAARSQAAVLDSVDTCNYNCDGVDIFVPTATPTSTDSVFSTMSVNPPYNVYRDQLTALSLGLALWNPSPPKHIYKNVSIGDVGYLHEGTFIRMFNVMLPWNHPSNGTLGIPDPYEPLDCGPFANTLGGGFDRIEHYSRFVSAESKAGYVGARGPDE
jgi:hypothetical protein